MEVLIGEIKRKGSFNRKRVFSEVCGRREERRKGRPMKLGLTHEDNEHLR